MVDVGEDVIRRYQFDEASCRDALLHDAEEADADSLCLNLGRLDVELRAQEPCIQIKTK